MIRILGERAGDPTRIASTLRLLRDDRRKRIARITRQGADLSGRDAQRNQGGHQFNARPATGKALQGGFVPIQVRGAAQCNEFREGAADRFHCDASPSVDSGGYGTIAGQRRQDKFGFMEIVNISRSS